MMYTEDVSWSFIPERYHISHKCIKFKCLVQGGLYWCHQSSQELGKSKENPGPALNRKVSWLPSEPDCFYVRSAGRAGFHKFRCHSKKLPKHCTIHLHFAEVHAVFFWIFFMRRLVFITFVTYLWDGSSLFSWFLSPWCLKIKGPISFPLVSTNQTKSIWAKFGFHPFFEKKSIPRSPTV